MAPTATLTRVTAPATRIPTPALAETPPLPPGVLFTDNFGSQKVSEDNGWEFEYTENVDRAWSVNKYIITVKRKTYLGFGTPDGIYDDFGAEVEALPNSSFAEYGIRFRADKDNYYLFGVTTDGKFYVQKKVGGQWADPDPVGLTASPAIKQGKVKNTLSVLAQGSAISLYVNGVGVMAINDHSIAKGQVGVFVGSGSSDWAEVAFSRFTVYTAERAKAAWTTIAAPTAKPTTTPAAGGGSGYGTFYVYNNFAGACHVTLWGQQNASIRAEGNSSAYKVLPPGTYGAKVALANGREADVPKQLYLRPGGVCSITCYEKSYSYGCN